MQIVNPLRAALPYITLQTAKVQHCWADYFIFSRVCGGRRPFRLRRNTQAKQAAGPAAPVPDFLQALKNLIKNPLTLLQIIPRWYIILP